MIARRVLLRPHYSPTGRVDGWLVLDADTGFVRRNWREGVKAFGDCVRGHQRAGRTVEAIVLDADGAEVERARYTPEGGVKALPVRGGKPTLAEHAIPLSRAAHRRYLLILGLSAWAGDALDEVDPDAATAARRFVGRKAKASGVDLADPHVDRRFWIGEWMPGLDPEWTAKEAAYLSDLESSLIGIVPPLLERTPDPGSNPGRWARVGTQSLLFHAHKWTKAGAQGWAQAHGYEWRDVDPPKSGRYWRLRQADPAGFRAMRTITFSDEQGIKAIIGDPR